MKLAAMNYLYGVLCERLERDTLGDPEVVLREVERVATVALFNHPGRFADGRIENRAFHLAAEADRAQEIPLDRITRGDSRPRVLHVASEVYEVGGHTRLLAKWIARDSGSHHVVALTRQTATVPEILAKSCQRSGGQLFKLPPESSRLSRAKALRCLAQQVDRIILHHHPNDPIPVVAFAAPLSIPVAFFNHAHFWFGLGGTVADITINTLPYFRAVTERSRFPRATALLTGVPGNGEYAPLGKEQAKRSLGLNPDVPVLLTIGAAHYYQPALGYDFFSTLKKILDTCGRVTVLVIGPRPDRDRVSNEMIEDSRVVYMGTVADPVPYYQAADVCLESFPMPSLGGFCEAVAYGGAFPVPVYGPDESILRIDLPILSVYSKRARDEAEYVSNVTDRVRRLTETRAVAAKAMAELRLLDMNWTATLRQMYASIDARGSHSASPIPNTQCSNERDHRLLAALKSFDLGCELHRHFCYTEAVTLNIGAARKRIQPARRVLSHEARWAWAGVKRRLVRTRTAE